jgi:hypothetical protein
MKGKNTMKKRSKSSKRSGGAVPSTATVTVKSTKPMKISRRIVDAKRHTVGYVVGGRRYNLDKADDRNRLLSLAREGRISGACAVGNHIQAQPGCAKLSTLPESRSK